MNHQPFENWLLDDDRLTVQQERELQLHLRNCTTCSAIAASNFALHGGRLASPESGFGERFRSKMTHWRQEQIRRQAFGSILLAVAGLLAVYALTGPILLSAMTSPAAWLREISIYLVAGSTILSVFRQVSRILLRDVQAVMPPVAWWWLILMGGLGGTVWTLVMRRLARAPHGV